MGRFLPSTTTIYNIKRSTVDVHKIDIRVSASLKKNPRLVGRLGSGPRVVGRLGLGVWVSASFQIFALTTGGMS